MGILGGRAKYEIRTVGIKGRKFNVEVADTFGKMAKGLMGHKKLGRNEGMLFIFESEGRHGFWMLNMKFSIDILWLDGSGNVVYMWEDAKPCKSIFSCRTVKPDRDAKYVIELCSGTAKRLGIGEGDRFIL